MNKKRKLAVTLLTAASLGDKALVISLLDDGADINARDREHGETPLMLALNAKKFDVATLLIERGADINSVGDLGRTALIFALHNNADYFITLLLDRGIDCEQMDVYNNYPLANAASYGDICLLRLFLSCKRCVFPDAIRQAIEVADAYGFAAIKDLLQQVSITPA